MWDSSDWAKTFLFKVYFASVFLLLLLTNAANLLASATEQIRIITTNDIHAYLKPIYYRYLDDIKPWGKVSREGDYVNKAKIEGKIGGNGTCCIHDQKIKTQRNQVKISC